MKRKSWFGIVMLAALLLVSISFLVMALQLDSNDGKRKLTGLAAGEKIGVLPLEGVITDSKDIIEKLLAFRDDDSIKAIVLRIDSPGGSVGPSQEIFEEVRKVDKKKPVITSVGSLAASGGYYVAVGTRYIISNPGSLVGSIGVIMPLYNAEELIKWAKIQPQIIKSGPLKDIGNPAHAMTEDERAALQSIVDDTYAQFVTAVTQGRTFAGMTTASVLAVADGRIFTGLQAKKLGMIDEIGTLRDTIAYAGKLVKIEGEPKIAYPREEKKTFWNYVVEQGSSSIKSALSEGIQGTMPATMFLWKAN